ncbi:MAG: glycoside hydrolase family 127 protein [Puniceicoccales bacterium]|nr:glycoside hydrolase family 127 protein [Puniceicoccales bacterium]
MLILPVTAFAAAPAPALAEIPCSPRFAPAAELYGGPLGTERVTGKAFSFVDECYVSQPLSNADTKIWIQIDLGVPKKIDLVKLYPCLADYHCGPWQTRNFPVRFKLEADDDPHFKNPRVIANYTTRDFPVEAWKFPGKIHNFIPTSPVTARFVRMTATKHARDRDSRHRQYLFELWRFEVFSDGKDVAQGRTLEESVRGYLGKHPLLRPRRIDGETCHYDNPQNVTAPETWKPVKTTLAIPTGGVVVNEGLFAATMQRNADYLLTTFTLDDLLRDFRRRAGKPAPGNMRGMKNFWVNELPGSNAGRFLMGAGTFLRWKENGALRERMNAVVDGIEACREPNGYYIMGYPENKIFYYENGGYSRAWVTRGLIDAASAGNTKALPLLRAYYDWFNHSPYLPELLRRGGFGRQGIIPSTLLYKSAVGKPEDIQAMQRYYQENFWMKQFSERDVDAVWRLQYDRPHSYLITSLEAYGDMYFATGEKRYLDTILGGWDIYHDYFEHIGGSFSVCEGPRFPPRSHLFKGNGELCGNVFWMFLNQRLHLLYPNEEKYVNEIEKSIYNVVLPCQSADGAIRYHAVLVKQKERGDKTNTCCEGQGTRGLSALPEFIYTTAADGLFVNLFHPSEITTSTLKLTQITKFPETPDVKLVVSIKHKNSAAKNTVKASIRVRVPAWVTRKMDIAINGKTAATGGVGSYVALEREWRDGDVVSFTLPVGFRVTKYEGTEKLYSAKESNTHALEYGPILLAIRGKSMPSGLATLHFPASELVSRLQHDPVAPLHFKIKGMADETLRYVPYYEIQREPMTTMVFFRDEK